MCWKGCTRQKGGTRGGAGTCYGDEQDKRNVFDLRTSGQIVFPASVDILTSGSWRKSGKEVHMLISRRQGEISQK